MSHLALRHLALVSQPLKTFLTPSQGTPLPRYDFLIQDVNTSLSVLLQSALAFVCCQKQWKTTIQLVSVIILSLHLTITFHSC